MTIKFELDAEEQFSDFEQELYEAAERLEQEIPRADREAAEELVDMIEDEVVRMGLVSSNPDGVPLRDSFYIVEQDDTFIIRSDLDRAVWLEFGTRPHVIEPSGDGVIRFESVDGVTYTMRVHHPGNRAYGYWRRAINNFIAQKHHEQKITTRVNRVLRSVFSR